MLQSPGQETTSKLISVMANVAKPYTGHLCSYEYNGPLYIGSTVILTKIKQEHKDGTTSSSTKFQNAITLHGFENLKYKCLQSLTNTKFVKCGK